MHEAKKQYSRYFFENVFSYKNLFLKPWTKQRYINFNYNLEDQKLLKRQGNVDIFLLI